MHRVYVVVVVVVVVVVLRGRTVHGRRQRRRVLQAAAFAASCESARRLAAAHCRHAASRAAPRVSSQSLHLLKALKEHLSMELEKAMMERESQLLRVSQLEVRCARRRPLQPCHHDRF